MALDLRRRETSEKLLQIDWDYPRSIELKKDTGPTVASQRMFALSRVEAFARLTAKDKRPLLILRECGHCKGTDDALLSKKLNNERTKLLARWFHCVKFKSNVLEKNHTFHHVFGDKSPPHLLLCAADGSDEVRFSGRQSSKELMGAMGKLLEAHYKKDADRAVKKLLALLSKFDHIDVMRSQLREQIETEVEAKGPRSAKLRKLEKKLLELTREMQALQERAKKTTSLGLLARKEV